MDEKPPTNQPAPLEYESPRDRLARHPRVSVINVIVGVIAGFCISAVVIWLIGPF